MNANLGKLSTANLATLASRVIYASNNGNYTVVTNHVILTELEEEYQQYDAVFQKLTYSGKGEEVAEMDNKRDRIFSAIKYLLRGYKAFQKEPTLTPADDLYKIIKKHGLGIDRLSYSEETAKMQKLLEDLELAENQTKITTLHLTEMVADLKTTQQEFELLYSQQAEENANLHSLPSASAVRKDLEKALRNYFNLLTVMKEQPDWKMLYSDINEQVKTAVNSTH